MNRVAAAIVPPQRNTHRDEACQPPTVPRHRAPPLIQKPRDPTFQRALPVQDPDGGAQRPGLPRQLGQVQQGLAIAQGIAVAQHVVVTQFLTGLTQLTNQAVHRHDRPVQRPRQLLQQDDQVVAPPDVGHLVHEHVPHLFNADRPE